MYLTIYIISAIITAFYLIAGTVVWTDDMESALSIEAVFVMIVIAICPVVNTWTAIYLLYETFKD